MITAEDLERAPDLRPRWWRTWQGDVAMAAGVGLIELLGTHGTAHRQPDARPLDALAYILLLAGAIALVARRRFPIEVYALVLATTLTYTVMDYPQGPIWLALSIAFFTVVIAGYRLVAVAGLAVGYVAVLWLPYWIGREAAPSLAASLGLAAWLLVLLSAAEFVRARRERVREAARIRVEEARSRAAEERLRIARELHDALGHHLSLINVQAGVALHLNEGLPEQARAALVAIREASKEALTELRSVLDILRQGDEQAPRSPTPSLERLDALVAQARAGGLAIRTETVGHARALPFGVDVAAYRIVQEALTNVSRYAAGATATIRIAYEDDRVNVQIDDDGPGVVPGAKVGTGKGIVGMRERVAALGGELEAGPRPEGGFRVRARLPLDGTR